MAAKKALLRPSPASTRLRTLSSPSSALPSRPPAPAAAGPWRSTFCCPFGTTTTKRSRNSSSPLLRLLAGEEPPRRGQQQQRFPQLLLRSAAPPFRWPPCGRCSASFTEALGRRRWPRWLTMLQRTQTPPTMGPTMRTLRPPIPQRTRCFPLFSPRAPLPQVTTTATATAIINSRIPFPPLPPLPPLCSLRLRRFPFRRSPQQPRPFSRQQLSTQLSTQPPSPAASQP